jgi:hypothetical protein
MTNLNNVTNTQIASFVKSLLLQKCSNYGYDYKDFKRISSQRSKERKALLNQVNSHGFESIKANLIQESRVQLLNTKIVDGNRIPTFEMALHYIVGQSQNEEITNLMRRLVKGSSAKWVK